MESNKIQIKKIIIKFDDFIKIESILTKNKIECKSVKNIENKLTIIVLNKSIRWSKLIRLFTTENEIQIYQYTDENLNNLNKKTQITEAIPTEIIEENTEPKTTDDVYKNLEQYTNQQNEKLIKKIIKDIHNYGLLNDSKLIYEINLKGSILLDKNYAYLKAKIDVKKLEKKLASAKDHLISAQENFQK